MVTGSYILASTNPRIIDGVAWNVEQLPSSGNGRLSFTGQGMIPYDRLATWLPPFAKYNDYIEEIIVDGDITLIDMPIDYVLANANSKPFSSNKLKTVTFKTESTYMRNAFVFGDNMTSVTDVRIDFSDMTTLMFGEFSLVNMYKANSVIFDLPSGPGSYLSFASRAILRRVIQRHLRRPAMKIPLSDGCCF